MGPQPTTPPRLYLGVLGSLGSLGLLGGLGSLGLLGRLGTLGGLDCLGALGGLCLLGCLGALAGSWLPAVFPVAFPAAPPKVGAAGGGVELCPLTRAGT